jgi:hypothetical protein
MVWKCRQETAERHTMKAKNEETRYNVTLPPDLAKDFEDAARTLGTTKADALRRALVLLKHALKADHVELVTGKETTRVLLR